MTTLISVWPPRLCRVFFIVVTSRPNPLPSRTLAINTTTRASSVRWRHAVPERNDDDYDDCIVVCTGSTVVNQRGLLFLFYSSECVCACVCEGNGHLLNDITIISSSTARSSLLMASHEQQRDRERERMDTRTVRNNRENMLLLSWFFSLCVCVSE